MAEPPVESPCTGVCRIDPTSGWCVGCLRSLDEIGTWAALDAAGRRAVLAKLPQRAPRPVAMSDPAASNSGLQT